MALFLDWGLSNRAPQLLCVLINQLSCQFYKYPKEKMEGRIEAGKENGIDLRKNSCLLPEEAPGLRACQPRGTFWPGKGVSLTELSLCHSLNLAPASS